MVNGLILSIQVTTKMTNTIFIVIVSVLKGKERGGMRLTVKIMIFMMMTA